MFRRMTGTESKGGGFGGFLFEIVMSAEEWLGFIGIPFSFQKRGVHS
jgi:hypothetical protein